MFGSIVGAIGGLIGGHHDREHDRAIAAQNASFQKQVYQNQLQWKAADAKKAGLHPLAALGGGSYSADNIASSGGTNYAGALGKLGEGIGDAFTAYMTKDEIAEKAAKEEAKADRKDLAEGRLLDAQTEYYSSLAMEASRRALAYGKPMASGREAIAGQVDARSPFMESVNKYSWPLNPDGSRGDPIPSGELSEAYENAPPPFSYAPFIDAMYDKWRAILTGQPIDGYYHDWRDNRWRRERPPKFW